VTPATIVAGVAGGAVITPNAAEKFVAATSRRIADLRLKSTQFKMGYLRSMRKSVIRAVGEGGEYYAAKMLRKRGYTDILPIQNSSGHGIDLICFHPKKGIVVVEVKGHIKDGPPRLSTDQRQGPDKYLNSRLARANQQEWFKEKPDMQAVLEQYVELIKSSPVSGIVINVDWALTRLPVTTVRKWEIGVLHGGDLTDDF